MEKLFLFIPLVPMVMMVSFLNLLFSRLNGRPFLDIAELNNTAEKLGYSAMAMLDSLVRFSL